jgi:preprotein translocase subunit YajC
MMQTTGGERTPGFIDSLGLLLPMGLILIIFYFLLIRPANKKQKALQQMIGNLKNGDKVITTGGIMGVVAGIGDDIIQLKIAPNVKIEVSRNAIAALQKEQGQEAS